MSATARGTLRSVSRFPEYRGAGFRRRVLDLQASSLGVARVPPRGREEYPRLYR